MKIEDRLEIDAPVSRVWDLTIDIEAWPSFNPNVTKVEHLDDGPVNVGSRARVKQPRQRPRTWNVTVVDWQREFTWATSMPGLTMTGRHLMEASGTSTLSTLVVEVEGILGAMMGPLVRRPIARALGIENQGFKSAAEKQ